MALAGFLASALAFTCDVITPFVELPKVDLTSRVKLYSEDPVYKGPSLTADALQLKHADSSLSLDHFFQLRGNPSDEDRALAQGCLDKVIRNESGTAAPETLSHLHALGGELHLRNGDTAGAIEKLEEALRLAPGNTAAKIKLLRAYEAEDRKLRAKPIPWSREHQERLRELGRKRDGVERELRKLRLSLLEAAGSAARIQIATAAWVTGGHPAGAPWRSGGICADCKNDFVDVFLAGGRPGWTAAALDSLPAAAWDDGDGNFANTEVLAVGVNGDGTSGFAPLEHAAGDAQRVAAAFQRLDFRTNTLTGHAATRQAILTELLAAAQRSRPGDVYLFYFSGHGFTDVHGRAALVTGGGGSGAAEALPLEEVAAVLSLHRGRAAVILDSCLDAVRVDLGLPARPAPGGNDPTVILAGEPGGKAIESPRLGSGLYTYALLRFLERQPANVAQGEPRALDLADLYQSTAAETSRLARSLYGVDQRPQVLGALR